MVIGIQDEILKINSQHLLDRLLMDKTTKSNIIWATDAYTELGAAYHRDKEITVDLITGQHSGVIKNRARKALEQQSERTRKHAEVFTPLWICEKMNDHIDEMWFGRKQGIHKTDPETGHIVFTSSKKWRYYVDSRRLEITCGEAPYLVSRYDVSTGDAIPLEKRIGILDRKLRVVTENATTEEEWVKWAMRAYEATYGYEFQGDNVLIARVNLLMTFEEYLYDRWERKPTDKEYRRLTNIICWNIWQMDGLSGTIPYCKAKEEQMQLTIDGWMGIDAAIELKNTQPKCRINDWRRENSIEFQMLNKGERKMKFDYIIGNPPYQESQETNNKSEAIYHYFYDGVSEIADKYMLISPARFLFNAGLTPKAWNRKMLSDEHLLIVDYFANSADVFPNTSINGGVAIIYRDKNTSYGAIDIFIPNDILRHLAQKFNADSIPRISSVMYGGRSDLKFNSAFLKAFPDAKDRILHTIQEKHPTITELGPGEEYEIKSSAFERTPWVFSSSEPSDKSGYYAIIGLENGKRVKKWIKKEYLSPRFPDKNNIGKYKIYISKADGAAGQIGNPIPARIIGKPSVAEPDDSFVPSFISIGAFNTKQEAENAEKYFRTKFARALIGVLKVTQDITPEKCKYVPLQDFTESSDIDWTKSVAEIDKQLYTKYGLDEKEIEFIETHVKEMA